MTLGKSVVKTLSTNFNLALRLYKPSNFNTFPTKFSPILSDTVLKSNSSLLQNPALKNDLDILCNGVQCLTIQKTDLPIGKKIIEPEKITKINIEIPPIKITNKIIELPFHVEKDITEPNGSIINKQARNILQIRRRKMKKHKRIKFLKRTKYEYFKKLNKREYDKEYNFQTQLKEILHIGETFDAEEYVTSRLKKINEPLPVTKARGRLAPQWVIQQCLKEEEEDAKYEERIQDCLKTKP